MDTPESTPALCLDCGQELHGTFCSRCGQGHTGHDLGLKHVLEEVLENFLNLDGRILGTLRLLFLHPGQATLEYLKGRRSRYLPPFRVYIFISFVLFLLLGLGSSAGIKIETHPDAPTASAPAPKPKSHREEAIEAGAIRAAQHPQEFKEQMLHTGSRVMFGLLPVFALLLFLLFHGARGYFVEHVIFSLHFHSFAFGLFILQWLLTRIPWAPIQTAAALLILVLPVHLGLAMKRVYGGPTWKIVLKGAVLTALYLMLVVGVMAGALFWVLSH